MLKDRGWKEICQYSHVRERFGLESCRFINWPLIFLEPLDQNQCLVPHLKDLSHICLEPEVQGHDLTFRVCNLGSKQPHLYIALYVVSIASQLHTTVAIWDLKVPKNLYNKYSRGTLLTYAYNKSLCKWGHFKKAKNTFKMLLATWFLVCFF